MEIKKKDMMKSGWQRAVEKEYIADSIVFDEKYKGIISLSIFKRLKEPLFIDYDFKNTLIADDNYKWLQIALESQNFWLTAMYDNKDNLVEIYFDITSGNHFDDIKNPYFYDLFTDIVITNDKNIYIVDENELEQALEEDIITLEQYNLVKKTTENLFDYLTKNKEYVIDFCFKNMLELGGKINGKI